MDAREYIVQFVVIREVAVVADDDLQAEREAYRKLADRDQGAAIALRVLNRTDEFGDDDLGAAGLGGAIAYEDCAKNWALCQKAFDAIDTDWVELL